MTLTRRSILFIVLISILTIGNISLLILALQLFPAYGGFTRQVIFIKPSEKTDSDGYFIIIDELEPESQNYNIDWLLHSRGELKKSTDGQSFRYTVPSYISNDDVSLEVSFLEHIDKIEEKDGYFLANNYYEDYPYDDLEVSYVKATYSGQENPIMAAVLSTINDSDSTMGFLDIKIKDSGIRKIGDNDFLYYNIKSQQKEFSDPNIKFNGQTFFLRRNDTNSDLIEYFYLQNAKTLNLNGLDYFSSNSKVNYILATYSNSSQISGCLDASLFSENEISLYCPFEVTMVKLDGANITFTQSDMEVKFHVTGSNSFVISTTSNYINPEYDPLTEISPKREKPKERDWQFDEKLIEDLDHPYTLFDAQELLNIKNKINDVNKNWSTWYANYISGVDDIGDPEDYEIEELCNYLYKLVLKYVIDGGNEFLDLIKDYLEMMGKIDHYSQDLKRAYSVQAYATTLDLIYMNLSKSERNTFKDYLYDQAAPLMEMDLYPENNHRVVDAGALGMAGLVLKDKKMINLAIDTILTYYYTFNPVDGGSYEGYSYNAYATDEFMQFAISLKRLEGYNLFTDPQIIATFDFMAETLGPLGMPSLYEDCTFSSRLQEVLLVAAANINDTYPLKAQNYQYIWEQRQNNSLFSFKSTNYYSYLAGSGSTFRRILGYNTNSSIIAMPYQFRKEIWKDSNMAFLRSDDTPNGLFLSFNCKDYPQSHVHYDENSFEIWAYGAYIVNNPGYPGFGEKHHDWTIASEASNTLLIAGSGQRQEIADGLQASISAPYFSMIIGGAKEIYNDLGCYKYFSELYLLIILNFIFIGVICLFFIKISKANKVSSLIDEKEKIKQDDDSELRKTSKLKLLGMVFIKPDSTIDFIYKNDPFKDSATYLNRVIKLLISGLMALFFVLLMIEMKTIVDYHLQYYEDKAATLFETLKIVVWVILIAGPILTFLLSLAAMKVYNRMNRFLVYKALEGQRTDLTKKNLNFMSSFSLIWQIPLLFLSFLLLYFTTAQSFKTAIHVISVGSGSIASIFAQILELLKEFSLNILIIILLEIPFLFITLKLFGNAINKSTRGNISKRKAWMIATSSILLLLIIFILLFITFIVLLKFVISLVSIEATIET